MPRVVLNQNVICNYFGVGIALGSTSGSVGKSIGCGDGVGVGIQIRQGLVFRYPAAEEVVGEDLLAGFVVDFDADVLPEILQRDFRAKTGTGGSLPPSMVGIDPSGLVADTLARRKALGFALMKSVVLPHDDLVNVRLIFSSEAGGAK